MDRNEEPTLPDLVYNITSSNEIRAAIEDDPVLREKTLERASVLVRSKEFKWLLKGKGLAFNNLERWHKSIDNLDESELDSGTAYVLKWMGGDKEPSEYNTFYNYNSGDNPVCGKGPLRLSYRQAHNLGITAQPDAYHDGDIEVLDDPEAREELIQITLREAGVIERYEEDEEPPVYEYGETSPTRGSHCIYRDVADNRGQISSLLNSLSRHNWSQCNESPGC